MEFWKSSEEKELMSQAMRLGNQKIWSSYLITIIHDITDMRLELYG